MTKKTETTDSQSRAFVRSMCESGWMILLTWSDGGHIFELLSKRAKVIIIQTYPQGHGFQVWRPVTESNTLTETRLAVEAYGDEREV